MLTIIGLTDWEARLVDLVDGYDLSDMLEIEVKGLRAEGTRSRMWKATVKCEFVLYFR
jgi:hypothetical protein